MGEGKGNQRLIQRAVQGDEVALSVLLARSRPQLCNYVSGRIPADLSRVVDPEDIVQEAHVVAFQRIGTLQSNRPESFDRWVKAIGLSQLRKAIKRHQAAKRGGGRCGVDRRKRSIEESTIALLNMLAGPDKTPSRSVARHEALNAMEEALAAIPGHYRQAVHLVHLEGRTVREAAQEMGRTERAIHGLCRRALKQLEQRLGSASGFLSSTG